MLGMLIPSVLLKAWWLKVRSMGPSTSYISWEGLTPHGVVLLDLDCWMRLHPTIMMEETFFIDCKVAIDQGK